MLSKVVAVQVTKSCLILYDPTDCSPPLSSTISWSLLEFMSTESVRLSNHLLLFRKIVKIINPILQIKKLRLREVTCQHAQVTVSKQWNVPGLVG